MANITLKGGVVREFDNGLTAGEICKQISMGLYKSACACKINGELKDLRTVVDGDCELQILTFEDEEGKKTFRHTASHILAQAVKRLYPTAKLTIGPAVENGFYYDFDVDVPFTQEVLEKLEKEMKKIVSENLELERIEMSADDATALMNEKTEPYKVELIAEHAGNSLSFAQARTLCRPVLSRHSS